ncbi:hypothetical protein PHMEG_00040093 [Phytophthora megakarya]|uniref:Reverse transcriptase Ty1/copia-type domain-containing protein n=1 Tax=Phytophthora megakarya TaxID=4795 RepID=A0A225UEI5_9STRA|nr:hypothetical protein PHMEG_00040093 [Phytophthora megakarya]
MGVSAEKRIYGLRQSPKNWNSTLHVVLVEFGFQRRSIVLDLSGDVTFPPSDLCGRHPAHRS